MKQHLSGTSQKSKPGELGKGEIRENQSVAPSKNEPESSSSGTRLHASPLAGGGKRERGDGTCYILKDIFASRLQGEMIFLRYKR
jgi:hypothetical protein